ncbi:MerR family transcriptional regulator [Vagococcus fluvialis]|jgi:DNA-binding transcriptional MerR regulator|uniref:MerR family transcriptional regulator n=1 Tax=Vagococcus fluvialis TaxID=2738 RepID=A0A7X6DB33_9ENTE|nr:MerR family transcriptional regulator [Vagococcus fluvialis]MDR2276451.1 MerR family transcriptional regulator [Vagococcus sp.]MBO0427994.1 MerR family transcriptional regulator [Vagococcus fluvialis]MBO0486337.1 MerR family transcriptional regulator [Vagococcus fluvialis]MCM2139229.1 MerR family transcriptional regulator [Vagococcus fluvialis]NKC69112.1 MerR family transcriptional regulator [Vagococcus fluvialis]
MSEKEFRRNLAVFPMSSVMKLTDLTARKIRYYEEQELIFPERNAGNNRLFSLNDIDRLLEIKEMISDDFSIKEIKKQFLKLEQKEKELSEEKIRIALYNDLMKESGLN